MGLLSKFLAERKLSSQTLKALAQIKDEDVFRICEIAMPTVLSQVIPLGRRSDSLAHSPALFFLVGYIRGLCWELTEAWVRKIETQSAESPSNAFHRIEQIARESSRRVLLAVLQSDPPETRLGLSEAQARRTLNLGVERGIDDAMFFKMMLGGKLPPGGFNPPFSLRAMFSLVEEHLRTGRFDADTPDLRPAPYLYAAGTSLAATTIDAGQASPGTTHNTPDATQRPKFSGEAPPVSKQTTPQAAVKGPACRDERVEEVLDMTLKPQLSEIVIGLKPWDMNNPALILTLGYIAGFVCAATRLESGAWYSEREADKKYLQFLARLFRISFTSIGTPEHEFVFVGLMTLAFDQDTKITEMRENDLFSRGMGVGESDHRNFNLQGRPPSSLLRLLADPGDASAGTKNGLTGSGTEP